MLVQGKSSPAPELAGITKEWRFFVDPLLLFFFVLFAGISLFLLYESHSSYDLVYRQAINYIIALFIFIVVSQIPNPILKVISPYLFLLGIILLILVLFFGTKGKGAQRWLDLGLLNIQPSEFFKILLPMMLAWWFNLSDEVGLVRLYVWLGVVLISFLSIVFIVIQPDLGTALMVLLGGMVTIFLAGLSWKIILFFMVSGLSALPFIWQNMHIYQKQRIVTFLDPFQDPLGSGYHIIQSMIAIGSGGLMGKGWQNGSQSRLDFVPEQHTDFIFTILAEEFGLWGSLILIAIYFSLTIRCLYISHRASTHFLRLLTATLSIMIFIYVSVNLAMVMGLLPVVGLPLPFISYGGSALITYAIILGILSSVRHQNS